MEKDQTTGAIFTPKEDPAANLLARSPVPE